MGAVFIGVPTLINLDNSLDKLATMPQLNNFAWIKAIVQAGIVALTALGGFMNTTYKEWQEKKSQEEPKT